MDVIDKARAAGRRMLSEVDSRRLCESYGIPLVPSRPANSAAEAVLAADELGYPVVLKGFGPSLAHKTEAGLVQLDLHTAAEVERAHATVLARGGAQIEGVLVQRMVRSGRELVAGMRRDQQFGPCVMFGLGGIFAEAVGDVVFRVAPLQRRDATEMLGELRGARLLGALRGQPAADREALCQMLEALGRLGCEQEQVEEIDLNPVLLRRSLPAAADALVVLSAA